MSQQIFVYSVPSCQNCDRAKQLVTAKGFELEIVDLSDPETYEGIKTEFEDRGQIFPRSAPILYIDYLDQYMDFKEFMSWIRTVH